MRILALGGVAGPVVFAMVTLVSAALRPGYSHVTNMISELGATDTPYAVLMNYAGFVPAGLMLAAFGAHLRESCPGSASPWPGRARHAVWRRSSVFGRYFVRSGLPSERRLVRKPGA